MARRDADGFMFTVKASMHSTNRRVLGEAGESIERFMASGLSELGDKLGPIVWQFMPTKAFDPDDFGAFLRLLPLRLGALRLRHAVEVRHSSFMARDFLDLARRHSVATVFADSDQYPSFANTTADFVYGRLMKTRVHECDRLSRRKDRGLGRLCPSLGGGVDSAGAVASGRRERRRSRHAARCVPVFRQRCQETGTRRRGRDPRRLVIAPMT